MLVILDPIHTPLLNPLDILVHLSVIDSIRSQLNDDLWLVGFTRLGGYNFHDFGRDVFLDLVGFVIAVADTASEYERA